jgi:hypothetical protein
MAGGDRRYTGPMHRLTGPVLSCVLLAAAPGLTQPADDVVVIEGEVPLDGPDFLLVPFEVAAGTVEVEVRHERVVVDGSSDDDVLDFGVEDPQGFRGWGGGNVEPAIIGEQAASRSYLPGPLPAGTWHVVVGRARVGSTAPRYRLEVVQRTTATLPPATDRAPYAPVTLPASSSGPRFFAGDLHVHSEDSGDARPGLAEIAAFARGRGLDFVVLTDHNTTAQVEKIGAAQPAIDDVLLVPGMEFTTYAGHLNAFGATLPVDHKLGLTTSLDEAVAALSAQGALVSINHPTLDLGDVCIGCAWGHAVFDDVAAVEIATGGYRQSGFIFGQGARDFWEDLLDAGHHAAPVGGSDDHGAGIDLPAFGSPIGDPTTLIFAETLSVAALQQGLRDNRTVVKLQGPDDPMITLETTPARSAVDGRRDTIIARVGDTITLSARVEDGAGHTLRVVRNGRSFGDPIPLDSDDVTATVAIVVTDDDDGARYRTEVHVDGVPRTITGHMWVAVAAPDAGGCSCDRGETAAALPVLGLLVRRRRRATPVRSM